MSSYFHPRLKWDLVETLHRMTGVSITKLSKRSKSNLYGWYKKERERRTREER